MADTRERERQWNAWWMRKKEKDGVWEVEEELGVKARGREREKTQTRETEKGQELFQESKDGRIRKERERRER